nr:MAG TPA: hypothetical protein [Caudoviricetes sp.]
MSEELERIDNPGEDPSTGEPQDNTPLYYRTKAKTVIMDDGTSVEDAINSKADKNHTHTAREIITDKDHQFVTEEEKNNWSLGSRYNKNIPTYVEHGGIPIGTTFNNKTLQEMFDMILYPYVSPTVSAQVLTPGNGGTYEIGTLVSVTKIRVNATIKSNNLTKIDIVEGSNIIATKTDDGVSKGGTFDFVLNIAVRTNKYFTAKVYDDTGAVVSKNTGTFTFVHPIYHGSLSTDTIPTQEEIKALTKHIESKGTKTYSFTANNQRFVFAYPKSYGTLSAIYDQNNFNVTSTFTIYTVPIQCLDGSTVDYYVYVSDKSTVTNFNNKFQW